MKLAQTYRERGRAAFLAVVIVLSVVAASTVPGGVVAYDADDMIAADLSDGDRLWQGQTGNVTVSDVVGGPDGDNDVVDLYYEHGTDDEDWVREYEIDDAGGAHDPEYIEVDTSGLEAGDYALVVEGTAELEFEIRVQSLSVAFDDELVSNVEGDASNTTIEIESSRSSFLTEVRADGLSGEDLDTIFAGQLRNDSEDTDDDFVVIEDRGDFEANFEDVDAGEYEFTFSVADTDAEDTATIDVADEEVSVSFSESTYHVDRSNVAEVTVNFENNEEAFVRLGDEDDVNYEVVFKVVDTEEAGAVTVKIDTVEAHTITDAYVNHEFFAITADDATVEIVDVTAGDLSEPMGEGDYELSVGTDWDVDGNGEIYNERDTAYLTLEDRSDLELDAITTQTAPDDVSDWDEYDATTVTETNTIAEGDELLVTVETDSLFAFFDGADDLSDLRTDNVWLEIEERRDRPNADPYLWTTNETHEYESDSSVFVDVGAHVTVANAYQPSESVILSVDYESLPQFETDGAEYDVYFVVGEHNHFADDEEFAAGTFTVEERTLEWADSAEVAPAAANAVLTGETNVAPGTEVTTRARAPGVFTASVDPVVEAGSDGEHTFEATYDFDAYDVGTTFTLTASEPGGAEDAEIESTLVEPGAVDEADELAVSIDDVTVTDGADATVSATVTAGDEGASGAAVITLDGDEVARTELDLGAGESAALTETIATSDLAIGAHALEVTFEGERATATLTVDAVDDADTDGDEADDEAAAADDGDAPATDDDDSVPGFGAAIALAGLLGAVMVALGRRD